ncbi:MAG TPA: STAS domain-containing protein [Gemmataceae bacterium]|nr:STAS domain-containing protein [Gemmataceae bacterium]
MTPGVAGSTINPNILPANNRLSAGRAGRNYLSETRGMSQQPRRRRLEVEDSGDVAVVQFVDKKILDEQNIQMIGDDLFRLVDELGRRKILLNFGNVEFLSSAALGKLITMNRKVQAVRGKLVLCNISREIREVFEITKLDKLFTILPDEQAALQAF